MSQSHIAAAPESGTLPFDNPIFFEQHKSSILATLGALLLIGTIAAIFLVNSSAKERAAETLLGSYSKPGTEMAVIADKFPNTRAAAQALLLGGDAALRENKAPEAARLFERFLKHYSTHPLADNATMGLAACEQAQGNIERMMQLLEKIAAAQPAGARSAEALLKLASAHQSKGAHAKARQSAEELLAKYPGSVYRAEAEAILVRLPKS